MLNGICANYYVSSTGARWNLRKFYKSVAGDISCKIKGLLKPNSTHNQKSHRLNSAENVLVTHAKIMPLSPPQSPLAHRLLLPTFVKELFWCILYYLGMYDI